MDFITEWGFDVQQGRSREYQAWLAENEEKLAESCPDGVEYMGTYATIYSSEKEAGGYRSFYRFDSYGAQDNFAAAMKDGGAFASLVEQATNFADFDKGANWSTGLHKRVTDASVWEPETD